MRLPCIPPVLDAAVIVAGKAHQDLAPFIELDLEWQVLQKGMTDAFRPFHDQDPRQIR